MDDSTETPVPCREAWNSGIAPAALYRALRAAHGPQGWWPLLSRGGRPGHDEEGYHRGIHDLPLDPSGRFEVMAGAILTQNTAWKNVGQALQALLAAGLLDPRRLAAADQAGLAGLIRPAGYFNQKAKKLLLAARTGLERGWWEPLPGGPGPRGPGRGELLALWGIGPETADSILLYAWQQPTFVVDAYTRRLLGRLSGGRLPPVGGAGPAAYEALRSWFQEGLGEAACRELAAGDFPGPVVAVYQEFHALIVCHAKQFCRSRPVCAACPLSKPGESG
jgi:endonuclease-3 related protein